MKLNVEQSDLNNAVQVVQRAVSSKTVLPILTGILFSAQNDYLDLCSTDLELSVKYRLPVKAEKSAATVLPARLISDIVRNLPDGKIEITVDENNGKASVSCDRAYFEINSLDAEDFPTFPTFETDSKIVIDGVKLATAVKQVIKSVSRDETRPVLCGILVTIEKGRLRLVATDSYRLSIHETAVDIGDNTDIKVIVPARCLDEVVRICGDKPIEIGLAKNQIYFNLGHVAIVSRLIEGNFPPYQKLIPESCESRVRLKKDALMAALKRVSLLAQNNALVKTKIDKDSVQIEAITADIGSAREQVAAVVDGDGMEIAFNAQYLMDGLSSISEEDVFLELNNPLKPGILKPTDLQDFIYLAMPVRIG